MKRAILFTTVVFLFLHAVKCQENETAPPDCPNTLIRLHFLVPGILVEQHIKDYSTIIFDVGTGFSYQYTEINGVRESDFYINPYLRIEPRMYTSFPKRKHLGRRTDYYSSQYAGFQIKIGFPTGQYEAWQSFGPLWGFQRTLGKKGYWNIGLGLGITLYNGESSFGGIGDFGIGFILN
jgi:hypothetical protein